VKDYRKYFVKGIRKNFPEQADEIIALTDTNFTLISVDTSFAATSTNPIDRRLDFAGYFLALIKALENQGFLFEKIREISLEIVIDYVRPKNKFQELLKKLPAKLINTWPAILLLKKFNDKVSKNPNADGFIANIITDKKETFGLGYGVDIIECGICKLFNKHNYQKYSSILCEVDAVTANMAGLHLIRNGTIALGSKKCDFRWQKK
jgi:hypothetical protein